MFCLFVCLVHVKELAAPTQANVVRGWKLKKTKRTEVQLQSPIEKRMHIQVP